MLHPSQVKTNHHHPIEPEDIRAGLLFLPSVGLCVISLPLFFLGLFLWGWQWKHMVELGVQVIRKVEHRILQLFGQNKKDLCLRLLQKIQRPGLHFRFIVLEGDTWKAEGRQLVMVRVGLSPKATQVISLRDKLQHLALITGWGAMSRGWGRRLGWQALTLQTLTNVLASWKFA